MGTLGLEPWAAGWEAQTLPLCYAAPSYGTQIYNTSRPAETRCNRSQPCSGWRPTKKVSPEFFSELIYRRLMHLLSLLIWFIAPIKFLDPGGKNPMMTWSLISWNKHRVSNPWPGNFEASSPCWWQHGYSLFRFHSQEKNIKLAQMKLLLSGISAI